MVRYTGACEKVKLQVTGPDGNTYTYNLTGHEYEAFPHSAGSGEYMAAVYENIAGISYAQILSEIIPADIVNKFGPFLYPNQYVDFTPSSAIVAKAKELAHSAGSGLGQHLHYGNRVGQRNRRVQRKGLEAYGPTFAVASSEQSPKRFIGDGSHYTVKYMY